MEVNEIHIEYGVPKLTHIDETHTITITVFLEWDSEASVWIATSEDLPSLVLECPNCDSLKERVSKAIPELLELSGKPIGDYIISFQSREPIFSNGRI